MKTPYDTVQRLKRQELDDVRQALAAAEAQLEAFAQAIIEADAALRREREVAAAEPMFDIGPYAAAKRAEMIRLTRELARLEDEIERLRASLLLKFEALKPLDFASDDYRAAKRAEAARKELAGFDEVAARCR